MELQRPVHHTALLPEAVVNGGKEGKGLLRAVSLPAWCGAGTAPRWLSVPWGLAGSSSTALLGPLQGTVDHTESLHSLPAWPDSPSKCLPIRVPPV